MNDFITIDLQPMATPRPRLGKYGNVHNTSEYLTYKKSLMWLIKAQIKSIPKKRYTGLSVIFAFKYTEDTPKYKRNEPFPKETKPDLDNLIKGLKDSLEQLNIIDNDSQISHYKEPVQKVYDKNSYIRFILY